MPAPTTATSEAAAVRWLHRRAGFGLNAEELRAAERAGFDSELARLVSGAGDDTDPWDDAELPLALRDVEATAIAIHRWVDRMRTTTSPLVDRMSWFWHGHFVSGLDRVKIARLMVDQIRLFRARGLGSFRTLLRDVTTSAAMLLYLDGATSTAEHPNENHARELLELFTLGADNVTEAAVIAGASALSGWTVPNGSGRPRFVPERHNDTRVHYLQRPGVHDIDGVIDAIVTHAGTAPFITAALTRAFLGTVDDSLVEQLSRPFRTTDFDIAGLMTNVLSAGAAGHSSAVVLAPVPWLAIAQRVTGARVDRRTHLTWLHAAGQVPMVPPNVAGWPDGQAWFTTSAVVARAQLAAVVAAGAPADNAAAAAATRDDSDALADALGLPAAFSATTAAALRDAAPGSQRLALALCSPEFVIA